MRSFKSNENIHKKEGGSYYVVSANKASSVTLQSPGNESQRKQSNLSLIQVFRITAVYPQNWQTCCYYSKGIMLEMIYHIL